MSVRICILWSLVVVGAGCIAPPSGSMSEPDEGVSFTDVASADGGPLADVAVQSDMPPDIGPGQPDTNIGTDASDLGPPADSGEDAGDDAGVDAGPADIGPIVNCRVDAPFSYDFQFTNTLWVDANTVVADAGDGTETNPFATLQQAVDAATPGTVIRLRAGTYSAGAFITNFDDGTRQQPYGIVGEQGVVFAGISGSVIQLKSPAWVLIENLRIEDVSGGHGINIDDSGIEDSAHHVVLRNLDIDNVGPAGDVSRCVRLTRVNDFIVRGGRISGCAYNGIEVWGAQRGLVRDVLFTTTSRRGLSIESGSADVLVHGNEFEYVEGRNVHVGGGGSLGHSSATFAAENVRVIANLFVLNEPGDAPIVDADCLGCVYANNAIWRPPGMVFRMLRENLDSPASEDVLFVNNNVTMPTEPPSVLQFGTDTKASGYTFGYNNWWVEDDATYTGPDHGQSNHLGGDHHVDPAWDGTQGRVTAQSPLIGAGKSGVVEGLQDSFGNCYQAPPTIGNHEAQ